MKIYIQGYMKGHSCISVPWQLFLEAMSFFPLMKFIFILKGICHGTKGKIRAETVVDQEETM